MDLPVLVSGNSKGTTKQLFLCVNGGTGPQALVVYYAPNNVKTPPPPICYTSPLYPYTNRVFIVIWGGGGVLTFNIWYIIDYERLWTGPYRQCKNRYLDILHPKSYK